MPPAWKLIGPQGLCLWAHGVSEAFHVALIPEGQRLACSVTVGVCAHMCVHVWVHLCATHTFM